MSIKLYPYIGLFTNNINDIRGLEFFEIYKNNERDIYEINNKNEKILKKDYSKLFIDGIRFLNKLYEILKNKDLFNPKIQKWTFEFFSNFIDFNEYTFENTFINYENDYDIINEIIQELNIDKYNINDISFIKNIFGFYQIFLNKFNYYIDKDNNKVDIMQFNIDSELRKTFDLNDKEFNSFYKNNNMYMYRISKINDQLNKKCALYFKILRNNRYEKIDVNLELINENKEKDEDEEEEDEEKCLETKLNIENKKCTNLLLKVIEEEGYGPYSKELFENDDNFIIYDIPKSIKKLNYGNMKIIMILLNKLKFKIKLIYLENLVDGVDSYDVLSLNANLNNTYFLNSIETKYIKYYENFENWELRQNISKKLNKQPHLRLYLNNCIEIINRRIKYLNPQIKNKDFEIITKMIFPNSNFKDSFKKLEDLIKKYQNIEYNKILKILEDQKNYTNKLIPEYKFITNNNYINNVGMVKTLLNKPSKRNLKLLTSILNSSYKFHKSLFEF